jgi:hypothetical protein
MRNEKMGQFAPKIDMSAVTLGKLWLFTKYGRSRTI